MPTLQAPGVWFMGRTEFGFDPVVRSSDGKPRPRLNVPTRWITRHYTGNPTPLFTADFAAVVAAMQGLERFAAQNKKPNEYNYVIFALADGSAVIAEYANVYQAAHSGGENQDSVGVLFWVGCTKIVNGVIQGFQDVPWQMVVAYRWLRDGILEPFGITNPNTVVEAEHEDMPGAATPCPGDKVKALDPQLDAPYVAPTPPPVQSLLGCVTRVEASDKTWYDVARRCLRVPPGTDSPAVFELGDEILATNAGTLTVGRELTIPGPHG